MSTFTYMPILLKKTCCFNYAISSFRLIYLTLVIFSYAKPAGTYASAPILHYQLFRF
uniref:Uncharacterized protein n=1 Tax=Anguilla anguilla TaxID=7936 RepID=A0A0E9Y1J0_ANGAN